MKKLRMIILTMVFVFSLTVVSIDPFLLYEHEIAAGAAQLSDNNGFVSIGTSISTSSESGVGCLEQGKCLKNGNYVAGMQSDGNLVQTIRSIFPHTTPCAEFSCIFFRHVV